MQEEEAVDFYKRLTKGTENYETIDLEHKSGAVLEGVQMHVVSKQTIADVISALPDELFDGVEDADSADEAREQLEDDGRTTRNAVDSNTVDAFEKVCKESLVHENLTGPQMNEIVENLDFETLIELGTEIINKSADDAGEIRGFQKQG